MVFYCISNFLCRPLEDGGEVDNATKIGIISTTYSNTLCEIGSGEKKFDKKNIRYTKMKTQCGLGMKMRLSKEDIFGLIWQ